MARGGGVTFDWLADIEDLPFLVGFCMFLAFWFHGLFFRCAINAWKKVARMKPDIGD